jgi:hypothetical protein
MPFPFILIHSPLVGPDTWSLVAEALRRRGHTASVPALPAVLEAGRPFWQQHVQAAARQAADDLAASTAPVAPMLVGHSGAGALLPAIGQALGRPVSGWLFVDAGLPAGGQSRLASFGEGAAEFRAHLAAGGRFPDWTEAQLAESVPDAAVRARLLAGLRPQPLAYWEEPLPVVPGWPAASGGYLLFSPTYATDAARARALGWPVHAQPGGHFHLLVEPDAVAEQLVALGGKVTASP